MLHFWHLTPALPLSWVCTLSHTGGRLSWATPRQSCGCVAPGTSLSMLLTCCTVPRTMSGVRVPSLVTCADDWDWGSSVGCSLKPSGSFPTGCFAGLLLSLRGAWGGVEGRGVHLHGVPCACQPCCQCFQLKMAVCRGDSPCASSWQ